MTLIRDGAYINDLEEELDPDLREDLDPESPTSPKKQTDSFKLLVMSKKKREPIPSYLKSVRSYKYPNTFSILGVSKSRACGG